MSYVPRTDRLCENPGDPFTDGNDMPKMRKEYRKNAEIIEFVEITREKSLTLNKRGGFNAAAKEAHVSHLQQLILDTIDYERAMAGILDRALSMGPPFVI